MIEPQRSLGRDPNLLLPFFVLTAVVANNAVFRLGGMSLVGAGLLAAAVGVLYVVTPDLILSFRDRQRPKFHVIHLLTGLVILAPLTGSLVFGWNREFPFSGDSYFHVGQGYRIAFWWLSPVASGVIKVPALDDVRQLATHPWTLAISRIVCLGVILSVTVWLYRKWHAAALGFATVALVAWGLAEESIFLRYPVGGYLLDFLFIGPAIVLNKLELGGRLSAVAAAFTWLFVLRPLLIGRWPDWRILPVGAAMLWQKDVIYYFDSVYLEPWAVVFTLVAVELLLDKGRVAAPSSCLLIGVAATIKEPFILALPLIWIAGAPWRAKRSELVYLTGAAFAAGVPFIVYFIARESVSLADMGADRGLQFGVSIAGLERYASEFGHQMRLAFPGSGGVLAAAVLLAAPVTFWFRPDRRLQLACLMAAGFVIASLFVVDTHSQRWAGYFRFLLCSLPFLISGLVLLTMTVGPKWLPAVGGVVLLLQAPSAYTAVARALGPSTDRNFVEHYDAPIVFPMRALTAEAERAGTLRHDAPVRANLADGTLRSLPRSPINYGALGELYCTCTADHPNVMALFVRFTNMSRALAHKPMEPDSRMGLWQRTNAQRSACLAQLRKSCGHVFTRFEGGELVGALGTAK